MCVGIENVGISFLTNHMLRAPLFVEAEGVWGIKAVRDSARQDDCGVTGHVGIWRAEKEQLQAVMPNAATELCLWVEDRVYCLCFISLLPAAHKIFFIMLVYAVWRGPSGRSGCKSSKRVRMEAYPVRSGTRHKLTKSERSIHALCDLVFLQLKSSNQWCTATLKINTFGVILMIYLLIEDSEYNKQYQASLFGFASLALV